MLMPFSLSRNHWTVQQNDIPYNDIRLHLKSELISDSGRFFDDSLSLLSMTAKLKDAIMGSLICC